MPRWQKKAAYIAPDLPPIIGDMSHEYAEALGFRVSASEHESFERELCRILADEGFDGELHLNDAVTGKPRMVLHGIQRIAANLRPAGMSKIERAELARAGRQQSRQKNG